jgi:hypothetical protein
VECTCTKLRSLVADHDSELWENQARVRDVAGLVRGWRALEGGVHHKDARDGPGFVNKLRPIHEVLVGAEWSNISPWFCMEKN